jgi:hypothetical protein
MYNFVFKPNMSKRPNLSRRDFLKVSAAGWLGLELAALGLSSTACGPAQKREQISNGGGGPSLPFFLAMTGMRMPDDPNRNAEAMVQLQKILNNPVQADNLLAAVIDNQLSVAAGNVVSDQAVAEGRAIGASLCSDSRGTIFSKFSAISFGESTQMWVTEARQAGAQPSLFRPNVTKSLFISHEALPYCEFGCGYLGGVEEILLHGDEGVQKLINHGVPQETIGHILSWKDKYGGSFRFDKLTPDEWAEVGGSIQAYMNGVAKGENHMVLFGVQSHGTGQFRPLGFVDETGRTISLTDGMQLYPELNGAGEFLNQPHPAIESLVAGQKPDINILSVSKHSPQAMFGDDIIRPGQAFVINHPVETISADSLDAMVADLVASQGYSIGALEQRGNMIFLTADNASDMARLRQALLGSSFADDFLKNGGLIVEMIPDEAGLFNRNVILRNLENPLVYLKLTPQEEIIIKNGAQKILGAVKVGETLTGETILIRVQSAVDGKIYDLQVPKGSAYSAITAETLEAAGLPAVEALWYEKALVGAGKFLGKAALVAGLLWMAYDGINYVTDLMGQGETVQFEMGDYAQIQDGALLQALVDLGLEDSLALRTYYGKNVADVESLLIGRIDAHRKEAETGMARKDDAYFIRLDSRVIGIPFVAPDNDLDVATSIRVTPIWHLGEYTGSEDGPPIVIDSFVYENVVNGDTMTIIKNPDGTYSRLGSETIKFSTVIKQPNTDEFLSIPLEFKFNEQGQEFVQPDYSPTSTSSLENNGSRAVADTLVSIYQLFASISASASQALSKRA